MPPEDRQQEMPYDLCCRCGGQIYRGQAYYQTEEGRLCTDCLREYAEGYFRAVLRTAAEEADDA